MIKKTLNVNEIILLQINNHIIRCGTGGKSCLDKVKEFVNIVCRPSFGTSNAMVLMLINKSGLHQMGWFLGYCHSHAN